MPVITISSSYGSNGAAIGHAVAERLGLTFYDRAIPVAVAAQLAVRTDDALERDEKPPSRMDRLLRALANMPTALGPEPASEYLDKTVSFREATEEVLRKIADGPGGVVLGRAGMVVLAGRPDVLSVRIDGPPEARIEHTVEVQGLDLETARTQQRDTDRAREAYSQSYYGVSQTDTRLYHLMLDSSAMSVETCIAIVVLAATSHLSLRPLEAR